jgi:hypothetical protein
LRFNPLQKAGPKDRITTTRRPAPATARVSCPNTACPSAFRVRSSFRTIVRTFGFPGPLASRITTPVSLRWIEPKHEFATVRVPPDCADSNILDDRILTVDNF